VNSGAYGCVFRDALPCKKKRVAKGQIGKVLNSREEADNEDRNNKIFKIVDPVAAFTLKYNGMCDVDLTKTRPKDNVAACDHIGMQYNKPIELIYEDGGIDLFLAIDKRPLMLFEDLIPLWGPIFQGLIAMKKAHVQHCDVKPDNILLQERGGLERLVLIDFGLITKDSTFLAKMRNRFNFTYAYYPPELKIYDEIDIFKFVDLPSIKMSIRKNMDGWTNNMIESPWEFISKFMTKKPDVYIERICSRYKAMVMDPTEWRREVIRIRDKLDTYSLGITIMEVAYYLFSRSRMGNPHLCKRFIYDVVLPMVHFDLYKRATPEEAAESMRAFLEATGLSPARQPVVSREKCMKPPGKGGYTILELRAIAKSLGITEKTRADICAALEKHTQ
jgi:serine/threonine protein kinase